MTRRRMVGLWAIAAVVAPAMVGPSCNSPDAVLGAAGGAGPGGSAADLGAPCTDESNCGSGLCVDGVCCDTACDAVCETCAGEEPGRCTAVAVGEADAECDGVCWREGACVASGSHLCHASVHGRSNEELSDALFEASGDITVVGFAAESATFATSTGDHDLDLNGIDGFRLELDQDCGFRAVDPVAGSGSQYLAKIVGAGEGHLLAGHNRGVLEATTSQYTARAMHVDGYLLYMNALGSLADVGACQPLLGDPDGCTQYYGTDIDGLSEHDIADVVLPANDTWYMALTAEGFTPAGTTTMAKDAVVLGGPNAITMVDSHTPGDQVAGGLTALTNGDLLMVGDTDATFVFHDGDLVDVGADDDRNLFIARYRAAQQIWSAWPLGHLADEWSAGVAAMDDGGYVVIGMFQDGDLDLGGSAAPLLDPEIYDTGFVARFDAEDQAMWAARIGSIEAADGAVQLNDVAVDRNGFIVVGGQFNGAGLLYTAPSGEARSWDTESLKQAFVLKLDPNGEAVWATLITGDDEETVEAVAVDPLTGAVLALGTFRAAAHIGEATIDNVSLLDAFVAELAP